MRCCKEEASALQRRRTDAVRAAADNDEASLEWQPAYYSLKSLEKLTSVDEGLMGSETLAPLWGAVEQVDRSSPNPTTPNPNPPA